MKQAPAILSSHLEKILLPMQIRLQNASSALEKITLARDIAFLAVAFSTTKRGAELTDTLIQRILRLPNESGLLCNLQWGKTMRSGADHLVSVPMKYVTICPVRAVETLIEVGKQVQWDMSGGYLFSQVSENAQGALQRGSLPVTTTQMSKALKG